MPEEIAYTSVGPRIRELRQSRGWSRPELARRSGVSRPHLYSIERGTSDPSAEKLFRLARALGVSPSEIFGDLAEEPAIPNGLQEFAEEAGLAPEDVRMLARIEYRGRRAETREEWKAIYAVIRAILED